MGQLLSYSLAASVFLLLLYPVISLIVNHNTNFRFNRYFLITVILMCLALPPLLRFLPDFHTAGEVGNLTSPHPAIVTEATADINHTNASNGFYICFMVMIIIYLIGIFCMSVRLFRSFISLLRIRKGGKIIRKDDYNLCVLSSSDIAPFSWGRYIFLNESDMEDWNSSILIHEKAHIRHRHWIDILLADIFCILLWYNPLAWKTRGLIKLNHEFEADRSVIQSGADIQSYQKLIVCHVMKKVMFGMTNSFASNRNDFRKRVLMIGDNRSSRKCKLLALCAVPAVVIGIFIFSFSATADFLTAVERVEFIPQEENIQSSHDNKETEEKENNSQEKDKPLPEFKGGEAELYNFLAKNMKYPEQPGEVVSEKRIVRVHFDVDTKGNVNNIRVKNPKGDLYEQEALRVVNLTKGRWLPAVKDGKPLESSAVLPFYFTTME
ncbi:MAG: M56 family metallopeptidase [Muribaculaceae bacterium]|nr:M56 family metallopeptidase [Muribaculaceae bacterium]